MSRSEFVELGSRRAESANPIDMSEVRETATEIAEDAARAIDDSVAVVGLEGEPAEEVVSYAADHDARYIVVSTRKRSPAGKALFGSVVQSILLNAECPVLNRSGGKGLRKCWCNGEPGASNRISQNPVTNVRV